MTYNVFSGTLNPTQSVNHICFNIGATLVIVVSVQCYQNLHIYNVCGLCASAYPILNWMNVTLDYFAVSWF